MSGAKLEVILRHIEIVEARRNASASMVTQEYKP
jgi:hypothetical protein